MGQAFDDRGNPLGSGVYGETKHERPHARALRH